MQPNLILLKVDVKKQHNFCYYYDELLSDEARGALLWRPIASKLNCHACHSHFSNNKMAKAFLDGLFQVKLEVFSFMCKKWHYCVGMIYKLFLIHHRKLQNFASNPVGQFFYFLYVFDCFLFVDTPATATLSNWTVHEDSTTTALNNYVYFNILTEDEWTTVCLSVLHIRSFVPNPSTRFTPLHDLLRKPPKFRLIVWQSKAKFSYSIILQSVPIQAFLQRIDLLLQTDTTADDFGVLLHESLYLGGFKARSIFSSGRRSIIVLCSA